MVAEVQHGKGNNGAKLDRDAGRASAVATAPKKRKAPSRKPSRPAADSEHRNTDKNGKEIRIGCVVADDNGNVGRVTHVFPGMSVMRVLCHPDDADSMPFSDVYHWSSVVIEDPQGDVAPQPEAVRPPTAPLYVQHAISLVKMLDFLSAHTESLEALIPEGWGDEVQSRQINEAIRTLHKRLTEFSTWCMTGRLTDEVYRTELARQENDPNIEYRSVRHLKKIVGLMDVAIADWWDETPVPQSAGPTNPAETPSPKLNIDGFGPVATKCLEMALLMEHAIQRFEEIKDMAEHDDPFSDDEKLDTQLQNIHGEFFTAACNAQRCADFNQRVRAERNGD
jgi:hypothetical protein